MKHHYECFESQPPTGVVIQPFFDHFNFLVFVVLHRALLEHILAQQTVEVLIATTLPIRKGSSKEACDIQIRVNQCIPKEFFAIIVCQYLDSYLEGCQCFTDRPAYQESRFV